MYQEHKDSIHSYSCSLSLWKFQSGSYKHAHVYFSGYCTASHRENFMLSSDIATVLSESLKIKQWHGKCFSEEDFLLKEGSESILASFKRILV